MEDDDEDVTEKRRKYFSEKSSYTPETRIEMQKVGEGEGDTQCGVHGTVCVRSWRKLKRRRRIMETSHRRRRNRDNCS